MSCIPTFLNIGIDFFTFIYLWYNFWIIGNNPKSFYYDTRKFCVSAQNGCRAIQKFFEVHPDYLLGLSIGICFLILKFEYSFVYYPIMNSFSSGTAFHESAFFLKLHHQGYAGIHYNPNPTGSMKVASEMHRILCLQSQLFGYHDPKGNINGMCSLLSWEEILFMFFNLKDPFYQSCLYPYNNTLKYCPSPDALLLLQKRRRPRPHRSGGSNSNTTSI